MRPSEQREPAVEEIIACVTSYYRGERELYVRHGEPLDAALRAAIARYFPAQLRDKVKPSRYAERGYLLRRFTRRPKK
jgi:hypothetical protein